MGVPIKFSHVLFQTRRYEEMLAWYQNVFEAYATAGDLLEVDRFDNEGAIAFMKSEAFAKNPIGVDVDPEELLQRYREGASNEELLTQPVGPMAPIPEAHGVT